jgi:hypothetical protein
LRAGAQLLLGGVQQLGSYSEVDSAMSHRHACSVINTDCAEHTPPPPAMLVLLLLLLFLLLLLLLVLFLLLLVAIAATRAVGQEGV